MRTYFLPIFSKTILLLFYAISCSAQLQFVQQPPPNGLGSLIARINNLAIDANDNKWVSFGNFGLGIFDGINWVVYNTGNSGLPSDSVICTGFDLAGNAWIGTKEGAVFKSGTNWTLFDTGNSGLPSNEITAVLVNGPVKWFGTKNGLVKFDGTTWNVFSTSNSGLPNDSVTALVADDNNNIWIGTRNGLAKFNNGNWTNFTSGNSPLNRFINDIDYDAYGRLWVSCGVLNNLQSYSTTGIYFIRNGIVKNFIEDFTFLDEELTYPRNVNFAKDISGNIYFPGVMFSSSGIISISGADFNFYLIEGIIYGPQLLGNIFEVDNSGLLWTLSRYQFHFYSFDFSSYSEMLSVPNFKNFRLLNINDVAAGINANGDMHWDLNSAKYEVPKGLGKNSVFASALWVGGIDEGGQIHLAGQTYRQTGNDFWPGPIDGINTSFDSTSCLKFDRIWKIDKWKIEEFKYNFLAGNISNGTYIIPDEILSWPSKGNGMVTGDIAPFTDFNLDGLYNPFDGDYPNIKGDQYLFRVFNDSLEQHAIPNAVKLGIEVHASAYAYYCPNIADSNIVLNRTTLYNYTIINKSQHNYDSVFVGLWCDMDLGNFVDDYVGCDTTLAAGYTYNGDNDDETLWGYGLNPPIQNIKILRGSIANPFDGIDNDLDGIIDEPGERTSMNHFQEYDNVQNSPSGNPIFADDFYNYLHSVWRNGQHITEGENGLNPLNPPSNFMYSGTPYDSTGWSLPNANAVPGDRRFIMSSGPVSLNAGDTVTIDFAYVFTWDSLNPNGLTTSIARNIADLQRVQRWFDNDNFPSCVNYSVGISEVNKQDLISIFPNPASSELYVIVENEDIPFFKYSINNVLGAEIKSDFLYSNKINIELLTPGIYILKLENTKNKYFVKFVKL